MLETVLITEALDMPRMDAVFGGNHVTFVGYPTEDGTPCNFFNIYGTTLAMASTCQNKEVAWEFIGDLIRPAYTVGKMKQMWWDYGIMIPINRKSYESAKIASITINQVHTSPLYSYHGGPDLMVKKPTAEDRQRYEELVERTTRFRWPEEELSDIVWETLGAYFAGDRTLDDTIRLIENRVGLYINEQK